MSRREKASGSGAVRARLAALRVELVRARRGILFLDFDGTLAPFREDPAKVEVYPGVAVALDQIMASGRTRLVIVTGRSIHGGLPAIGTRLVPEVWGSHGRERRLPGRETVVRPIDEKTALALAGVDEWAEELEGLGARCELKPGAFAVDWRWLAFRDRLRVVRAIAALWESFPMRAQLARRGYEGGIEFRAPGFDKGDVVRTVLSEEAGESPCAYLGDDDTDEDAFAYLRGRGFTALVRQQARATAAGAWLMPPGELLDFLADWNRTLGSRAR